MRASLFVEAVGGEVDLAAGGGELDGVRDEVVERLQDAVGVGPDADAVGGVEDADVGAGGAGLLQGDGAAEEVFGAGHGELQLGLAGADAFEVEDVVDQADEAVGVADGDLEHLLRLLGAGGEGSAGEQAEGSAERGERRAELVGDGGDELVLHAVEGAALGGVGEGDDDADCFAWRCCGRCGFDLGAGYVFDGEAGAVFAPEDLVGDADGVAMGEAVADGGVVGWIGGAVGAGVLDEIVGVAAEYLCGLIAEHLSGCGIDDGDAAVEVGAEDAVADGLEDGVGLAGEGAETAFDAGLLGDVDAEAEDVGVAVGDVDELVAIGDDADFAVGVREMQEALGFAGLGDFAEVDGEGAAAVLGDELGEGVADHVFEGVAEALGSVGVDGEHVALEVVGADHAE